MGTKPPLFNLSIRIILKNISRKKENDKRE